MKRIEIRPRFEVKVGLSPEKVLKKIREELSRPDTQCSGKVLDPHAVLQIPDHEQHYWSPQLTVEVERSGNNDGCSVLRCIMGPMPAVWTMFASFYALSVFTGLVGIVWGGAQWSLGMYPYALWLIPISVIMIICAYSIALAGQKLGYDQMIQLHEFLDRTLNGEKSEK